MPRRPRIHLPGAPLHIVQRGHNREPCFFAQDDYHAYLHWLGQAIEQHGVSLYAYVLMTNHVHLLLSATLPQAIPRLIMSLGRHYVQHINRTYRRTGTLWDSRYKSSLVQTEGYFLACLRYIEINPVRAAMVADPGDYRWSSYRFHAFGAPDKGLTTHPVYLALAADDLGRQRAYRDLLRHTLDRDVIADIRLCLHQGQPLGDSRFHDTIARVVGHPRNPRPRGRPRKECQPNQ
jgi:putative transposase